MQAIYKFAMGRHKLHIVTHHGELVNGLFFWWFYQKKISKDVLIN